MAAEQKNGSDYSIAKNENNGGAMNKEKYTHKFDGDELSPLKSSAVENAKDDPVRVALMPEEDEKDTGSTKDTKKDKNKSCLFKSFCNSLSEKMELTTKRSRLIVFLLILLCLLLFLVVVALAVCWPRIASYMTKAECVEKECIDAASQILRFANTSKNSCDNPYEFACDNFGPEYVRHEFYGLIRGEWNFKTSSEYKEIKQLHAFISKLDDESVSYSAQSKVKILHRFCMNLDHSDTKASLDKAFHYLHGFHYLNSMAQTWDFRGSLTSLQSRYGPSPFYRISVENHLNSATGRYSGNVIVIDEGDLSLPNKIFYSLELRHPIISAFKQLLRDVALRLGVLSDRARLFADEIFHYEKRIVTSLSVIEQKSSRSRNAVMTLAEVKKLTPSLPILSTIAALFPNSKITEQTLVMVRDIEALQQISIIVSTTDTFVLNTFLIWSLVRSYLPFLTMDYRTSLEDFERTVYGIQRSPPMWYFCTKLVDNWMPLAVDVLQNNPQIIMNSGQNKFDEPTDPNWISVGRLSADLTPTEPLDSTENYLKLIYYHLRNELKDAINSANWINENLSSFLVERLMRTELQIGLPNKVTDSEKFITGYYEDFMVTIHTNNLQSRWDFIKKKMEMSLQNTGTREEELISELYPIRMSQRFEEDYKNGIWNNVVKFNPELNVIILSKSTLQPPYFNSKYPIAVNFARIGKDLVETMLNAIDTFNKEYLDQPRISKRNVTLPTNTETNIRYIPYGNDVVGESLQCVQNKVHQLYDPDLPETVKLNAHHQIRTAKVSARAFKTFLRHIDENNPIENNELPEQLSYESLGLTNRKRQPGLRQYDDEQLFTLTYLQNFCAVISNSYERIKPFTEDAIPNHEMFDVLWTTVKQLSDTYSCSVDQLECNDLL